MMYVTELNKTKQDRIRKALISNGISKDDLERAMNSKIADLRDLLDIDENGDIRMSILDQIRQMKEDNTYDRAVVDEIADKMEELIGPAEMWNTLRPGFEQSELLENLEYIAKENEL